MDAKVQNISQNVATGNQSQSITHKDDESFKIIDDNRNLLPFLGMKESNGIAIPKPSTLSVSKTYVICSG